MDFRTFRGAAQESLAKAAYDPKKLATIHVGAALLLSLIVTVINYLLGNAINGAGGIANLGNRAVLSTAQSALSVISTMALPFWQIGFLYAALQMARSRDARPLDLTEGFRRFAPVVRLFLLECGIVLLVVFACMQIASILFSFTPFLDNVVQIMQDISLDATEAGLETLSAADLSAMLPAMIPMYVLFAVVLGVIGIPLFYRFRLARFALMDDAGGARKALKRSAQLTRGNKWKLFKLDLQFWWYYGALLLIAAIAYLDVLLTTLGVTLPVGADMLYFGCFFLYLVLHLAFSRQFDSQVQTTYAHCYLYLKENPPTPPQPKPLPTNVPWDNPQ